MTKLEFGDKKGTDLCKCLCHKKNMEKVRVVHRMPCCEHAYEKYIENDGSIDMDRLKDLK